MHETSAVHRSALGALRHLTDLARDAGSRRLLCYHDAITPAIEFALFATHRLNVFEPPPVPHEPASGAGSRPLICYQGKSPLNVKRNGHRSILKHALNLVCMRLVATGGGRDRLGAVIVATAAFLRQLLDPDGTWHAYLMLWELQHTENADDALGAWLSSHALPGTMQIVFQGLGALQQVARASVVLGDALYEMRRSLLHLLGAAAITHVVRLGLVKLRKRRELKLTSQHVAQRHGMLSQVARTKAGHREALLALFGELHAPPFLRRTMTDPSAPDLYDHDIMV